jgi:hypothetical protein
MTQTPDSDQETADTLRCDGGTDEYGEQPWRDEDLLRELYLDEQMSANEISDELECGATTVRNWLHRHDIPTRSISEAHKVKGDPVPFWTRTRGHEVWCESFGGQENAFVYVHRLAAMAWHGVEETANTDIIHHKNEIPWDNREENLKLIEERGDHFTEHRKFNDLQRLRVAELYENGDVGSYVLADELEYDINPSSVRNFHEEAFGGDAGA